MKMVFLIGIITLAGILLIRRFSLQFRNSGCSGCPGCGKACGTNFKDKK